MEKLTCKTCVYFRDAQPSGLCHLQPPLVFHCPEVAVMGVPQGGGFAHIRPAVDADDRACMGYSKDMSDYVGRPTVIGEGTA